MYIYIYVYVYRSFRDFSSLGRRACACAYTQSFIPYYIPKQHRPEEGTRSAHVKYKSKNEFFVFFVDVFRVSIPFIIFFFLPDGPHGRGRFKRGKKTNQNTPPTHRRTYNHNIMRVYAVREDVCACDGEARDPPSIHERTREPEDNDDDDFRLKIITCLFKKIYITGTNAAQSRAG